MSAARLFVLLLVCVAAASAVIHKIRTTHHAIESQHHHGKHFPRSSSLRHQLLQRHKVGKQASVGSLPLVNVNYLTTGTITVGTPAQSFNVEVDAFFENDVVLIDAGADLSNVDTNLPKKQTYNSSLSSTYVAVSGNISAWGMKGHKAQDVLNVDSLSTTLTFAVADKIPYFFNYYAIDGALGLSPTTKSWLNVSVTYKKLLDQLDNPVVSVYVNQTAAGNGTGQVTVGAEDSDNCQSSWSYVPNLKQWEQYGYPYTVHASTAEVTVDGQLTTYNLDANVTFSPWPAFDVPAKYKSLFVNGTGAAWNSTYRTYTLDCDTSKAPLITLNIGGSGNSTDDTTRQLVLSGADYVRYVKAAGFCYLGVNFYGGDYLWYLGSQVLNNHCISFNYKDRTVGFADSNTPKNDVTAL